MHFTNEYLNELVPTLFARFKENLVNPQHNNPIFRDNAKINTKFYVSIPLNKSLTLEERKELEEFGIKSYLYNEVRGELREMLRFHPKDVLFYDYFGQYPEIQEEYPEIFPIEKAQTLCIPENRLTSYKRKRAIKEINEAIKKAHSEGRKGVKVSSDISADVMEIFKKAGYKFLKSAQPDSCIIISWRKDEDRTTN